MSNRKLLKTTALLSQSVYLHKKIGWFYFFSKYSLVPTYGTPNLWDFFRIFSSTQLMGPIKFHQKDRSFENFSCCRLSDTIMFANFSLLIPLMLKLYVTKACLNIKTGKKLSWEIQAEMGYFLIISVFFLVLKKSNL